MTSERKPLAIDLDDDLDLDGAMASVPKKTPFTDDVRQLVEKASEAAGFPSREARPAQKKKEPTKRTERINARVPYETKEAFRDLCYRLRLIDSEAVERALLALAEKEGMVDISERLRLIVGE